MLDALKDQYEVLAIGYIDRQTRAVLFAGRVFETAEALNVLVMGSDTRDCKGCHIELTHGGYLVRFSRMPDFRRFQTAVIDACRNRSGLGGAEVFSRCRPRTPPAD